MDNLQLQEAELRKGPWLGEEDEALIAAVSDLGERRWESLANASGLRRSGKSCRLRWMNYLRPNLKHGHITPQEEALIIQLQGKWGNRWSKIARSLPGRTDNEIKNYWKCHLRKKSLLSEQHSTNNWEQNSESMLGQDCSASSSSDNGEYMLVAKDDHPRTGAVDDLEMSTIGLVNSPFENRLLDWSSWNQCSQIQNLDDDYCYYQYHPGWASSGGYNETSLWDSTTFSIWDMD